MPLFTGLLLSASNGAARATDRPSDGFEVAAYALELAPNIQARSVEGRETITLKATVDGVRRLAFSPNALKIDLATINGVAVGHTMESDALVIDLPDPLERGRDVKLVLTYHGRPARGFSGSATTLYTSYFACDWMICQQKEFGRKSAFTIDLRVPAGMASLSVGSMVARRPGPAGGEVHTWTAPRPYSAYLFGFAIGPFARFSERIGTRRLSFLSATSDVAELRRRFAETREMVTFLSKKAGLPLPVNDYSQVLVPGDEAQEAATYSVLGAAALPSAPGNPFQDWAIVHELAHQWWGNLVTCSTLREFWLNEGITAFMTAAWKEHRYGRTAYEAELEVARSRLAKAQLRNFDRPLAWDGAYPDLGTRRAIQYSKGALFMAQLRTTLGDAAFWAGLRKYTRSHAGGSVTSLDLQRAMQAASGRDLQPLFREWVFGDVPTSPQPGATG